MSMLKEYYLQPNAPDPALPEAEVLRCVRRFVPTAKAMTRVDESGGEARTYIVDEAIVLKVQRPQQVRVGTSLAREAFFLNQLAAAAPDLPALAGYTADAPVSDDFMRTWTAVTVAASAILVAFFPDREDEATRDLRQSLSDL